MALTSGWCPESLRYEVLRTDMTRTSLLVYNLPALFENWYLSCFRKLTLFTAVFFIRNHVPFDKIWKPVKSQQVQVHFFAFQSFRNCAKWAFQGWMVPDQFTSFSTFFCDDLNIKGKVICTAVAIHLTKPLFTQLLFIVTKWAAHEETQFNVKNAQKGPKAF